LFREPLDVRANTTRAVDAGDGTYRLTGHKWFCSAPQSDAFLVLAQAPGALSRFLVPRVLPAGGADRRWRRLRLRQARPGPQPRVGVLDPALDLAAITARA
jgi:alkylation response protein AidB-like acyl-CoA dehydrogenase